MAHFTHDEHTYVVWATSVASIAAVTVAEVNAGANLSTYLPADGLKRGAKDQRVDDSNITTRHENEFIGTYGEAIELTLLEDDGSGSDLALTTFQAGYVTGFLCVRRKLLYTTVPAIAQKWEVYPAQSGPVKFNDTARNARATFAVAIAVTSAPNKFSVMA